MYETVFSIPVGEDSIIQYDFRPTSIHGPIAIAVLPDDSIMIADFAANHLLQYDQKGTLLNIIELEDLGIKNVIDLRVKGYELFLLELSYQNYNVHQMTQDGALIISHKIPHNFPIEGDNITLENSLKGIAIDCESNIILEVAAGSRLLHLADIQAQTDLASVTKGYFCDDEHYNYITPVPFQPIKFTNGDVIYETHLTTGAGSITLLDAFQDGSFYVFRGDRVKESPGQYDLTVHYIGPDGIEQGAARIPHNEFYFFPERSAAIDSHGEVFALLPRPDAIEVVRLNFYRQLEPLIPEAIVPHVSISPTKP